MIRPNFAIVCLALVSSASCATTTRKSQNIAKISVVDENSSVEIPTEKPHLVPEIADPDASVAIAAYSYIRQVAMYYAVDLKSVNEFARDVSQTIKDNDALLRQCYSNRLDETPNLKGNIVYEIHLYRNYPVRVAKIGGSISDKRLESCLTNKMKSLAFNPQKNMGGTVTYQFHSSERIAAVARN